MYLIDPAQVSEIDAYVSREQGISVTTLMGNAGRAIADEIARRVQPGARVLILTGPGNNGGDGYAAGFSLVGMGYTVRIIDAVGEGARSSSAQYYARLFSQVAGSAIVLSDIPTEHLRHELDTADVIVDAVFGTGARVGLPDAIASLMKAVASSAGGALRVAADVPTGVDARDGRISDGVFSADLTVCFGYAKRGMYAYPARRYCGEILIADIGFDKRTVEQSFSFTDRLMDDETVSAWLPKRSRNSHKGTFGKLLLLCGSRAYRGAAALASEAALRGGVGLAILASHDSVLDLALSRSPELVVQPLPELARQDRESMLNAHRLAAESHAILIGCGSGTSVPLGGFLWELLAQEGGPLVIDADGLNSLSLHREESLARLRNAKRRVILTPHPLELSRLLALPVSDIQADRIGTAVRFAAAYGVTLVLKGAGTVIAGDDGSVTVNPTGSSALSKGGSGDVLAGLVASLAAQGVDPVRAAAIAVYLHGAAGDALAREYSEYGVLPRELPEAIARELCRVTRINTNLGKRRTNDRSK